MTAEELLKLHRRYEHTPGKWSPYMWATDIYAPAPVPLEAFGEELDWFKNWYYGGVQAWRAQDTTWPWRASWANCEYGPHLISLDHDGRWTLGLSLCSDDDRNLYVQNEHGVWDIGSWDRVAAVHFCWEVSDTEAAEMSRTVDKFRPRWWLNKLDSTAWEETRRLCEGGHRYGGDEVPYRIMRSRHITPRAMMDAVRVLATALLEDELVLLGWLANYDPRAPPVLYMESLVMAGLTVEDVGGITPLGLAVLHERNGK